MNILIVSATINEIKPFYTFLHPMVFSSENITTLNNNTISVLVTGPGSAHTCFSVAQFLSKNKVDLAVNVGIAGSFDFNITKGSVLHVIKDRFADLGVVQNDESFTDIFEMGLISKDKFPYQDGWIHTQAPQNINMDLPEVIGVTVNMVSGSQNSINRLKQKYNPDIESMEGAAFLFSCKMMHTPCLQIRSVSNYVEPRNKNNWNIPLAIETLNDYLIRLLEKL
ncbi:MAG: futalosine hydrolase [Saprospiraceae bacterium]